MSVPIRFNPDACQLCSDVPRDPKTHPRCRGCALADAPQAEPEKVEEE